VQITDKLVLPIRMTSISYTMEARKWPFKIV
jgi:hypothetical protein